MTQQAVPGSIAGRPPHAIQTLVAARREGRWRVELFWNTPAAFHGRLEKSKELTEDLRAVLRDRLKALIEFPTPLRVVVQLAREEVDHQRPGQLGRVRIIARGVRIGEAVPTEWEKVPLERLPIF
jgi:hypothetical protein